MPRVSSFPTLYDDCKTLTISDLKRWEYLKPGQWKRGAITWSRNGNKTGSISITTNFTTESPYLELDYTYNKTEPINYRVPLVRVPSNLGKGFVWYFVCPRTGKKCRKLYMVNTYFYHRTAFNGCMYEKQTYSHHTRIIGKQFERMFGEEKAYEQIYSKHFKKQYKGKPTRRYLRLLLKTSDPR